MREQGGGIVPSQAWTAYGKEGGEVKEGGRPLKRFGSLERGAECEW